MADFFNELLTNAFGEQLEDMLAFLQRFVAEQTRVPMDCRHSATASPCFSTGTPETGKAAGIRKTTILAAADQCTDGVASTKVRTHHLFFLAASDDGHELRARLDGLKSNLSLVHLCGDGICRSKQEGSCCNPSHLEFAPQGANRDQTVGHSVLSACETEEERAVVLRVFGRVTNLARIF